MPEQIKFFKEAMRYLSASSYLEDVFTSTFDFLCKYFPLAGISLDEYMPHINSMNISFVVTKEGFFYVNEHINVIKKPDKLSNPKVDKGILHHKDSNGHDLCVQHGQALREYLPNISRSYLISPVHKDDVVTGYINFVGKEENCFNETHEALFELLIPYFSQVLVNSLEVQSLVESKDKLGYEKVRLERRLEKLTQNHIIGAKTGLKKVFESLSCLENSEFAVLIQGEPGVGKNLLANFIHSSSLRKNSIFFKFNCGAVPSNLQEGKLFGFEGTKQLACLVQAQGGTLFLDEVESLSLPAQDKLVQVLETKEFDGQALNVRLLASSSHNLEELCEKGQFNAKLYEYLNVFPLYVPPLRERREDILLLIKYFADKISQRIGISYLGLAEQDLDLVLSYAWPGNVGELENMVEQALILYPDKELSLLGLIKLENKLPENVDLDNHIKKLVHNILEAYPHVERRGTAPFEHKPQNLDDVIKANISMALTYCNGKISGSNGAAEILGVNHNTLRTKMKKLGIKN